MKVHIPTETERLEDYFCKLESLIPNPGEDWAKSAKECKYLKMLKDRKLTNA